MLLFISNYEYLIEGTNANTNIQPVLKNFKHVNNLTYSCFDACKPKLSTTQRFYP